jgi:hypothetical protein
MDQRHENRRIRKHKILGLIFDTRMNWNEQILSIQAKAEKSLLGGWQRKPSYEHYSKIYTDGSKIDEKVRYVVVLSESTIKKRRFPQNSIYSPERSAIINAFYSTANYNQKRVITTDSLSTIMAVSDRKRSQNPKTQLIRKLIDQASTNITLLWVPSRHLGLPGNEAAADAGKEALNEKILNKSL